jgi:PAS domain S-box-containing protein
MPISKPNNLIHSIKNISQSLNGRFLRNVKKLQAQIPNHLHQKAFDNSFLPNIISVVSNGKILAANHAAERLTGYSDKGLLSKNFDEIFAPADEHFKGILKQRRTAGHATGDSTLIRKNGRQLPCQITSVVFTGDNHIQKAITIIVDRSEGTRRQPVIDLKKENKVPAKIIFEHFKSDATLTRLHNLEHMLDKEITAKESSLSASLIQLKLFEKERKSETKLKAIQIANAISETKQLERSDLGKELHDNVAQLLTASRMYMDLARRNAKDRNDNFNRSSEYMLTAIEEIRKLSKGLVTDTIQQVGLCNAINKMTHDLMQAYPLKIICKIDDALPVRLTARFELDIFRIVQEQLNNIIKYANASRVTIDLSQNDGVILLSVTDNGIGFDVTKEVDGIGIINIKGRAAFYKGNADFISKPGKGCVLTASFPIEHAVKETFNAESVNLRQ